MTQHRCELRHDVDTNSRSRCGPRPQRDQFPDSLCAPCLTWLYKMHNKHKRFSGAILHYVYWLHHNFDTNCNVVPLSAHAVRPDTAGIACGLMQLHAAAGTAPCAETPPSPHGCHHTTPTSFIVHLSFVEQGASASGISDDGTDGGTPAEGMIVVADEDGGIGIAFTPSADEILGSVEMAFEVRSASVPLQCNSYSVNCHVKMWTSTRFGLAGY